MVPRGTAAAAKSRSLRDVQHGRDIDNINSGSCITIVRGEENVSEGASAGAATVPKVPDWSTAGHAGRVACPERIHVGTAAIRLLRAISVLRISDCLCTSQKNHVPRLPLLLLQPPEEVASSRSAREPGFGGGFPFDPA